MYEAGGGGCGPATHPGGLSFFEDSSPRRLNALRVRQVTGASGHQLELPFAGDGGPEQWPSALAPQAGLVSCRQADSADYAKGLKKAPSSQRARLQRRGEQGERCSAGAMPSGASCAERSAGISWDRVPRRIDAWSRCSEGRPRRCCSGRAFLLRSEAEGARRCIGDAALRPCRRRMGPSVLPAHRATSGHRSSGSALAGRSRRDRVTFVAVRQAWGLR